MPYFVFFELTDVKEQASKPIVPLHVKREIGGNRHEKRRINCNGVK